MAINPNSVGTASSPSVASWTSKDALLYALGIGCGVDDLQFTTENSARIDQRMFPTMVVTLAEVSGVFAHIGTFDPARVVHGEQRITWHGPLPVAGSVTARSLDAATGELVFETMMSAFIRGEGGWGGDRGRAEPRCQAPDRDPDHVVPYRTSANQALIYRLSGDRNPLHSDPAFASLAGFDRPILHGLCSYGMSARALLAELCGSDPERFVSMEGRFTSPVFPGEELTVSIWRLGDGVAVFRTAAATDGRVVIDNGGCGFRP